MDERCAKELVYVGRIWAAADTWRVKCHALASDMRSDPDVANELMYELQNAMHTWLSLLSVMLTDYAERDVQVAMIDELLVRDDADRLKLIMGIGNTREWMREVPTIYDWSLVMHKAIGDAVREATDHACKN